MEEEPKKTTFKQAFIMVMSLVGIYVIVFAILGLLWMLIIKSTCS